MRLTALIVMMMLIAAAPLLAQTEALPDGPPVVVKHEPVQTSIDGTSFNHHLYLPANADGPVPGVVVFPEWWGVNDYAKLRGRALAQLGYAALVVDLYGDGKVTTQANQAAQWSSALKNDEKTWRQRAVAAVGTLRDREEVKDDALAAIGYCFGGTTALQTAYANPKGLQAVVSFHGHLPPPNDADKVTASIMVAHGAADPFVPDQQITTFRKAMEQRKIDYLFIAYGGAVHSFTNPGADAHNMDGVAYDKNADQRSWAHMKVFFGEMFGRDVTIDQPRVELPKVGSAVKRQADRPIVINIMEDGTIRYGGKAIALTELSEVMERDAADRSVLVRADARARYGGMMPVIEAVQRAGVTWSVGK
jgi:dienelactone hydrolase